MEDYEKLQSLFLDDVGKTLSLSRTEFVDQAHCLIGQGSKEEYGHLFDRVILTQEHRGLLMDSADKKGECRTDWEGLSSYLLLELSDKEEHARAKRVPRWRAPRTLTSPHRDPVQQVAYLRSSARYLSVSKGGTLGLWGGEDFSLLQSQRLHNSSVRPRDLWVTSMVVLHNINKIAVSFTTKEVCFYDLLSKQELSLQYKLQGLRHAPLCLDYWADPAHPDQAVLTIGDTGGQVSAICFRSAQISLFERLSTGAETESDDIIKWEELAQGRHHCCYTLTHREHGQSWVRRVRFLGSLEAFVSCSTSAQSSMVIGWREQEGVPLRLTAFQTEKGANDLDHHPGLNLIATAGVDNKVLLWNPYVIFKPVGVLRGHLTSVTAVRFVLDKKQLISYSKDKVLRLWDVSSQLCIQLFTGLFPRTQEESVTLVYLHEEPSRLLLSFNSLLLLLEGPRRETGHRALSHHCPVTCVIYNSLFRQVISSDSGSSVVFWLPDTGHKVKQFHRCHGNAEISTMALDGTQTRLFTAGTDGMVKVWDFNGHCHHRLDAGREQALEISQLLVLNRSVLVMGWGRMLTVFRLHSFSQFFVQPSEWKGGVQHQDHILCATFQPPQALVTGSYDGEITVWNNSTENALRKLRPPQREPGVTGLGQSQGHASRATSEEGPESTDAVTRLYFLPGRGKGLGSTGCANLVSCGGSGVVRFWNTVSSSLVGEFTAHRDAGAIIMTVSSCGRYLVTADITLKAWDILNYCYQPEEGVTNDAPELLGRLRPHLDCVTHLETCIHGDRLLLLSASSDCCVALSYLPGHTVGIFGQEEHWHLEGPGATTPMQGAQGGPTQEAGSSPSLGCVPSEPGTNPPEEEGVMPEAVKAEEEKGMEREEERGMEGEEERGMEGESSVSSCILERSFEKRLDLRVIDSRPVRKETPLNSEFGKSWQS
ncbi:cilia- and flagella-associated protein 337-like [Osmerus mordax]|uniref:cilia- and flagella-associated protein 337-like n=1 Tax=Osmerus mordax TaxID=8014 RepID=UPI00350FA13F